MITSVGDTFVTFLSYIPCMRSLIPSLFSAVIFAVTYPAAAAAQPGFAVVELFTSEGCSSCPPADEALVQLSNEAAKSHFPLYVLEWHVDYWDYLGWKDPFDSSIATLRQRTYARALSSDVYTPQVVVNGSSIADWAGDEAEVASIATSFMKESAPGGTALAVSAVLAGRTVRVHADVSGAPQGSVLLVALVETGLSSTPAAGENAGRKLLHSSVVRAAASRGAVSGDIDLSLPEGTVVGRSGIFALIQDPSTMKITLAASATISSTGRVSARIVNPDGSGVAGALAQVCSDRLCVPARTGLDGVFTLAGLPSGSYTLSVNDAVPVRSFALSGGESLSLGTIKVGH